MTRYRIAALALAALLFAAAGCATSARVVLPDGAALEVTRVATQAETEPNPLAWGLRPLRTSRDEAQVVVFTRPGYQFGISGLAGDPIPPLVEQQGALDILTKHAPVVDAVWLDRRRRVKAIRPIGVDTPGVVWVLAPSHLYSGFARKLPVYAVVVPAGWAQEHGLRVGDKLRLPAPPSGASEEGE